MNLVNIKCPHCMFEKNVDRAKIPDNLKEVKCPKCKKSFPFEVPEEDFVIEELPPNNNETVQEPTVQQPQLSQFKFCSSCGNKIHAKAEICTKCGVRVASPPNSISKVALLLITFFLGGIGGHKFYTKKYLAGALYLLFFWTYIPGVVSLVEFFIYAFKSESELQEQFPDTSGGAIVLAVIVPFFFVAMMGILAAIAIPQFAAYRQKAYNATAQSDLSVCKDQVETYYTNYGSYPIAEEQIHCQPSNCVALYYFPLDQNNYQMISFHDKGTNAYISEAANTSIEVDEKDNVEQEIGRVFGQVALERKFHVLNSL